MDKASLRHREQCVAACWRFLYNNRLYVSFQNWRLSPSPTPILPHAQNNERWKKSMDVLMPPIDAAACLVMPFHRAGRLPIPAATVTVIIGDGDACTMDSPSHSMGRLPSIYSYSVGLAASTSRLARTSLPGKTNKQTDKQTKMRAGVRRARVRRGQSTTDVPGTSQGGEVAGGGCKQIPRLLALRVCTRAHPEEDRQIDRGVTAR